MSSSSKDQSSKGYFVLLFDPDLHLPEVIWTADEAFLGRSGTKMARTTPNFCPIGDFKNVSRTHAHIFYDMASGEWAVKVLGSKGAVIDCENVARNQIKKLSFVRPTPIRMGNSKFYFCPPTEIGSHCAKQSAGPMLNGE